MPVGHNFLLNCQNTAVESSIVLQSLPGGRKDVFESSLLCFVLEYKGLQSTLTAVQSQQTKNIMRWWDWWEVGGGSVVIKYTAGVLHYCTDWN